MSAPNAREVTTRVEDHELSLVHAGWSDTPRIELTGAYDSLSWGNLRTLAAARREKRLGQRSPDAAAAALRRVWLGGVPPPATPLPVTSVAGARTRVIVFGDTGDGSEAQQAVALQVAGRAGASERGVAVSAVLIQSDIVYPAGAANEYARKFFRPYRPLHDAGIPIYAIPGNHDWDDGALGGFMGVFCGMPEITGAAYAARDGALSRLQRALWAPRPGAHVSGDWPTPPSHPGPVQTCPFLALLIGGVLYIGIDTGYGTCIDHLQAEWLVDLAGAAAYRETPKVLFTGKPLIVNGRREPCPFAADPETGETAITRGGHRYDSVDDVVREPGNGFVAAMGGDIHNYQRYLARIVRGSASTTLPYLVAGGGGVFIGQTYWLPRIDDTPQTDGNDTISIDEHDTVLFPTRAHSFLYWDKLVRQSRRSAQFASSVALTVAAVASILLWVALHVLAVVGSPQREPSLLAPLLLLATAATANMSARPITRSARVETGGAAVAVAALVYWWLGRTSIGAGLVAGAVLLQLADISFFGRGARRLVHRVLAVLACLALALAATGLVATSFGRHASERWSHGWALAIALVAIGAMLALTRCFYRTPSVRDTYGALATELTTGGRHRLSLIIRLTRIFGQHQKLFSIFETFNDGRLRHRVRRPSGGGSSFLPLYRSFVEIESLRDEHGMWQLEFTAYGVTGEDTTDTGGSAKPVVVDRFQVRWRPGELEITT
jgi:hypothetical protein